MNNENSVVTRYSIKLNVRLDKLLEYRREGEGLSSRITAICDRFEVFYNSNSGRVGTLFSKSELDHLECACRGVRTQAGWLNAYIEKLPLDSALLAKMIALPTADITVLEELLARNTCNYFL